MNPIAYYKSARRLISPSVQSIRFAYSRIARLKGLTDFTMSKIGSWKLTKADAWFSILAADVYSMVCWEGLSDFIQGWTINARRS